MYQGYIKLWRKVQDSDLWKEEKFTRGQAWVDLIMLANHKPGHIRIRGIKIDIDRGQLAYSELSLSKRWKWSRGKTRRFLQELSSNPVQQIEQQTNNLTSLITIINYEQYQGTIQQTVQQTDTKQDTKRYTNKNVKNDKNIYTKDENFKFLKKVPLPTNIFLTDRMKEYVKKQGCENNGHAKYIFEGFINYYNRKGTKWQDWTLTFYDWVRNDKKKYNPDKYKTILTGKAALEWDGS